MTTRGPLHGFLALYDDLSARYDRDASPGYFRLVLAWLTGQLPLRGRVLDLGCGTGRYALALAARGLDVVAVDESGEMIRRGRDKPHGHRVDFRVLDVGAGLPEGRFDAVLLIDVWEFLADPAKTLWHVRSVLGPGASAFIVTPHPGWRVPIVVAERLGIKRLAPAYGFRNGGRRVIEVAALAGGLTVKTMSWIYGTLARTVVLEEAPEAIPRIWHPSGERGRPAGPLAVDTERSAVGPHRIAADHAGRLEDSRPGYDPIRRHSPPRPPGGPRP